MTPEEIFAAAKEDPAVKEVMDTYIRRLETGIPGIRTAVLGNQAGMIGTASLI